MPFQSKAQARKMFSLEAEGKVPKGTAEKWAHETPGGIKKLPEKKKGPPTPKRKKMAPWEQTAYA